MIDIDILIYIYILIVVAVTQLLHLSKLIKLYVFEKGIFYSM